MIEEVIRGQIIHIIDPQTYDMKVTHVGQTVTSHVKEQERIYAAEVDDAELSELIRTKKVVELKQKLVGKEVRCYILSRDLFGRLTARVKLLS